MKDEEFFQKIKALQDDVEWDRKMVRAILRKKTWSRVITCTGTGTAAAAVIVSAFYLWLALNSSLSNSMEQMITAQIDGTYGTVFPEKRERTAFSSGAEREPLDADIDSVIENTLEMR